MADDLPGLRWKIAASRNEPEWDLRTLESLGMIPNYYLQYFYYTDRKVAAQKKWPPSRAEEVMEIEKDLLREYADPALTEPPADLMKRGGAYYSTLATQLINSHHNDLGQVHVVNVRNNGAVKEWPADWVLEMPARVDKHGHPPAARRAPAARLFRAHLPGQDVRTAHRRSRCAWRPQRPVSGAARPSAGSQRGPGAGSDGGHARNQQAVAAAVLPIGNRP